MPETLQTSHVREMAANLLLGRALQLLEAAGGMVVFQDASGRWQTDRFALKHPMEELDGLRPLLEAVLEWTLYTEKPVAVANLRQSRWSQHLLGGRELPGGAIVATPLAQRGAIWGAIVVFRDEPVEDALPLLGQLAELAIEPLSSLGAGRPEGVA